MNFFEHQDRARRSTLWLIALFALAVLAIITAVNVAVFGIATIVGDYHRPAPSVGGPRYGTPREYPFTPHHVEYPRVEIPPWELFAAVTGATLVVIIGGSLYKIAQLSRGGHAIAQVMGARPITANATDAREKQLLNVVEEMSIASGFPVPGVYVLDDEPGINAFAAGFTPADSVITVTRGTLDTLNRDELQGVIAHEYSHLLNGDTRLNLRLVGILHGILVIGLIGYALIRTLQYVRPSSSRSSKDKDSGGAVLIAIILLGVSLLIIGYVGMFFANLIQAAVCRAREFLADASAVQFTRNPGGIEGALKKIGGAGARGAGDGDGEGSNVNNAQAMQVAHMFFASAMTGGFTRLMSTHPPLADRIRAIDPNWDGRFIAVAPAARSATPESDDEYAGPGGFRFAASSMPHAVPVAVRAEDVVRRVGAPTPMHVRYAVALLDEMPPNLRQAARDPFTARTIVFCLLLSDDPAAAQQQIDLLSRAVDPTTLSTTVSLAASVGALGRRARLPLLDLCIPALRQMSAAQLRQFKDNLRTLIDADATVTPAEFVLFRIIDQAVRPPDEPVRRAIPKYAALRPVIEEVGVLLSALALASNDGDAAQAANEYAAGAARLGDVLEVPPMLPRIDLAALDQALGRLAECAPGVKRRIIDAAAYCVATDGVVDVDEAELLRAVAATLDCPLPPLVSPPAPAALDAPVDQLAARQ